MVCRADGEGEGGEGEAPAYDPDQDMVAYVVAAEELDNSDEERRRVRHLVTLHVVLSLCSTSYCSRPATLCNGSACMRLMTTPGTATPGCRIALGWGCVL